MGCLFNGSAFRYYRRLARVRAHLEAHIDEPFPLASAADVAGLNPKYFSTFFRSKVGLRFTDWVNHVRTERAKALISSTNRSITRVAEEVGYADLRTFERAFKRHNAVTAKDFKRGARPT